MQWRTGWVKWIYVYFPLACVLLVVAKNPGKTYAGPGVEPPAAKPAPAPTPPISPGSVPAPQAATPSAPASAPTPATTPKPPFAPKLATPSQQTSGSTPTTPPPQASAPEPKSPAVLSQQEAAIGGELPEAKPVPAMQVVPLPYDQASFQYLGRELTRYHFGPSLQRPFLYPVAGPEGRSLTRMGHPRDPFGHSHHNSVWISHADVGGVNFWADRDKTPPGRILCQRIEQYEDGPQSAWLVAVHAWQDAQGKTILLERRRIEVQVVDPEHWWILIDMELAPPAQQPVTIGQSPFGMIGVRMAKTIGVADGGGRLLNSEGQRGEVAMFRKPARWVDYSGPILPLPPTGTSEPKPPGSPSTHQAAEARPTSSSDQPQTTAPARQPPPPTPSDKPQRTPHADQPRPSSQTEQPRPSSPTAVSAGQQASAVAGNLPTRPSHFGASPQANLGVLGPANSDAPRQANLSSPGANTPGAAGLGNSDAAGRANLGAIVQARSGNPSPGVGQILCGDNADGSPGQSGSSDAFPCAGRRLDGCLAHPGRADHHPAWPTPSASLWPVDPSGPAQPGRDRRPMAPICPNPASGFVHSKNTITCSTRPQGNLGKDWIWDEPNSTTPPPSRWGILFRI